MAPNFKIIETLVNGNITVAVNTQINNLNADEVTVSENVSVRLFGKIHKALTIKKGAVVILHGTIYGAVNNEGGELSLFDKKAED
jgi:hypothetical protein